MDTPTFPEANHPLIAALANRSDLELLDLFKRYPDAGRYFVTLFCRYSPIVYTLVRHSA
ncbi:MAG: sigma-70 family RNA polymerase sigma factor, partial [Cyanobacteria bacterium P01_F01_bin.153]